MISRMEEPRGRKREGQTDAVFVMRHTDRPDKSQHPESSRYPGTTEGYGVDAIRERALPQIIDAIDTAAPDAIVAIAGASEEIRTKSTSEIVGDLLKEHYRDSPRVLVVTRSSIDTMRRIGASQPGSFKITELLKDIVAENPDKKVVIDYPLFIKELSLRPHFRQSVSAESSGFSEHIAGRARERFGDTAQIDVEGTVDRVASYQAETTAGAKIFMEMENKEEVEPYGGILPADAAARQWSAINRLGQFVQNAVHTTGAEHRRPILLGLVGHGWNLDALVTSLVNEGKANAEGFRKIGDTAVAVGEAAIIRMNSGEVPTLIFRGKECTIPPEVIENVA